jgi:hypothetical protein
MALLKITDASGRQWEYPLTNAPCTIGRAPDNTVVLDDPRASRYHAHIKPGDDGTFTMIDGRDDQRRTASQREQGFRKRWASL